MNTALILLISVVGCTKVRMDVPQMESVIGRTMELGLSDPFIEWNLTQYARGTSLGHAPTIAGELLCNSSLEWKSKYSFISLSSGGASLGFVPEGMNEKGFTISALTLRSSSFPGSTDHEMNMLCYPMIVPYLLSTVATVEEAKRALSEVNITNTLRLVKQIDFMKFHWAMSDSGGNHWILEYINKQPLWYKDEIGILTNDPPYPWHVNNLDNYVGLSPLLPNLSLVEMQTSQGTVPQPSSFGTNLLGMPGDLSPPSRFVRTFFSRQFILSSALNTPTTVNGTMCCLTSLLNSIHITKGLVAKLTENANPEMTHWGVLKRPASNVFYFRTYCDLTWKMIDLNHINVSETKTMKLSCSFSGVENVTSSW
eukprot:TRINITY_DN12778_c0_g1_i1.p1 TRINITY_DN12778_c0_g1~~TRINITY_DN12778_c0_g1_i1.p1  ORF type:complete len:368 (+),score=58.29 TRINITY_DN12778_c0_g1_i1:317-1420(+)